MRPAANPSQAYQLRLVRTLNGAFYRRQDVAEALHVTPRAVLAIGQHRADLAPTHRVVEGQRVTYLYTAAQVEGLRRHFARRKGRRRGRPRLWTLAESGDRTRRYDLMRYYLRRAQDMQQKGRSEVAELARRKAAEMRAELDRERDRRLAERAAS